MKNIEVETAAIWVVIVAVVGMWLVNHAQQIVDAVLRIRG
jgi:hypothetical protein